MGYLKQRRSSAKKREEKRGEKRREKRGEKREERREEQSRGEKSAAQRSAKQSNDMKIVAHESGKYEQSELLPLLLLHATNRVPVREPFVYLVKA